MRKRRRGGRATCVFVSLTILVLSASPALAHKISIFAAVEGEAITGEAFARGGDPIRSATICVFGTDGQALGETTTDSEGKFRFVPTARRDHRLVLDAGDGHLAEKTVSAEELPATLPGEVASAETPKETDARSDQAETVEPQSVPASASGADAALLGQVQQLSNDVRELRKELAHYQDELRLRDLLGGIGFIFGLMGVAFYFLGVRRKGPANV